MRKTVLLFGVIVVISLIYSSCKEVNYLGVGFYNVENLFDTIDDPETFDGEYLPDSAKGWNSDKYTTKLNNLAKVISTFDGEYAPDFLGLCEVENKAVVEDLIATAAMKPLGYEIVHHESSDRRGIDVAAIYNPKKLELIESGIQWVDLSEYDQITRDILWVKMKSKVGNELFYFFVNHWPSRRGGLAESEPKRIIAANTLRQLKDSFLKQDPSSNIVIVGDFNDEPSNTSVLTTLNTSGNAKSISNEQLFNAMTKLDDKKKGSYCYRGNWNMLDQIMVNNQLLDGKSWECVVNSGTIRDDKWLKQASGDYKNYPLRTFGGRTYLAGYSDHLPVYVILKRKAD
jgi:predicted extracellular nuclease